VDSSQHGQVSTKTGQLQSREYQNLPEASKDLLAAIVASGAEARERLEQVIAAVVEHGTVEHLTDRILAAATELEQQFSLSPPDALVLSSVIEHLKSASPGRKVFVSQDKKGFADPAIYDELSRYECKVLVNFDDALAHIQSVLRGAG
jgi:predicted nucleic acid-binding protein